MTTADEIDTADDLDDDDDGRKAPNDPTITLQEWARDAMIDERRERAALITADAAADHQKYWRQFAEMITDTLGYELSDTDTPAQPVRTYEIDGLQFQMRRSKWEAPYHLELIRPCPTCNQPTSRTQIDGLASLGEALDAPKIYPCDDCRERREHAATAAANARPTPEEQLIALIRALAQEEAETLIALHVDHWRHHA